MSDHHLRNSSAEVDIDDVKAKSRTCNELIDAEYAEARQEQINCQANLDKRLHDVRSRHAECRTDQIQAKSIRWSRSLLGYWCACSIAADAAIARLVSKAGLEASKGAGAKEGPPKRASQTAARQ